MSEGASMPDDLDSLFTRRHRLGAVYSLALGSGGVQRHLRLTMDDLENRMLLVNPQRAAAVFAHHSAAKALRKAA